MSDNRLLKIISNETKNSVDTISIVTPSMYASIFAKLAKEHKLDLEDEDKIAKNLVQQQCTKLIDLQNTTSKNINSLDENTTKAISAIETKDDNLLKEVLQETKALRDEVEKLKTSIYNDELTKAFNRKWLHDHYLSNDGENFKKSGTLAIIDLNYFKQINDTHGHIIGDKVLVFITNELRRTREAVVRYGGDEFIILFHKNVTPQKATSILNDIRDKVHSKKLKAKDTAFRVSFSLGATEYHAQESINDVIEKADKIMYEDKTNIKKKITGI